MQSTEPPSFRAMLCVKMNRIPEELRRKYVLYEAFLIFDDTRGKAIGAFSVTCCPWTN